ncbi:MAG: alpha/beta hydrolase fold domain-containing protein [Pirellulales bacterium]
MARWIGFDGTVCSLAIALAAGCCLTKAGLAQSEGPRPQYLKNVIYAKQGDEELEADVFLPLGEGPHPGVLLVHGGAWSRGHKSEMKFVGKLLADQGYTAVSINYRLAPKHPFPAQLEDCQTAVRWMRSNARQYKIDPRRVGGYGYSAGGNLVALLATMEHAPAAAETTNELPAPSTRLQAVVCGGTPFDFRGMDDDDRLLTYWLGTTRRERPGYYRLASPAAFVTADDPPFLLFHGQKDQLVDPASSRNMLTTLRRAGVPADMFELEEQGHMQAMFNRQAPVSCLEFFDRYLKLAPPKAQAAAP